MVELEDETEFAMLTEDDGRYEDESGTEGDMDASEVKDVGLASGLDRYAL